MYHKIGEKFNKQKSVFTYLSITFTVDCVVGSYLDMSRASTRGEV